MKFASNAHKEASVKIKIHWAKVLLFARHLYLIMTSYVATDRQTNTHLKPDNFKCTYTYLNHTKTERDVTFNHTIQKQHETRLLKPISIEHVPTNVPKPNPYHNMAQGVPLNVQLRVSARKINTIHTFETVFVPGGERDAKRYIRSHVQQKRFFKPLVPFCHRRLRPLDTLTLHV